jgi:predicted nucleic-acid-binding Zn-ribbon protein
MKRLFPWNHLFIAAGMSLYLSSCTLGTCFDETESRIKASFYSSSSGKAASPDSITLYGMSTDTNLLYIRALKPPKVEIPLYVADTSRKFILRTNGIDDTIEFRYSSYLHVISKECGYTYFYNLDTAICTIHAIDSITIIKQTISTLNEENLRIFF